jgi:hypothetical protein
MFFFVKVEYDCNNSGRISIMNKVNDLVVHPNREIKLDAVGTVEIRATTATDTERGPMFGTPRAAALRKLESDLISKRPRFRKRIPIAPLRHQHFSLQKHRTNNNQKHKIQNP